MSTPTVRRFPRTQAEAFKGAEYGACIYGVRKSPRGWPWLLALLAVVCLIGASRRLLTGS